MGQYAGSGSIHDRLRREAAATRPGGQLDVDLDDPACNNWDKYGCGGNSELRKEAANVLKTKYPRTEWARKVEPEPEQ
jgi:hypothetical protein